MENDELIHHGVKGQKWGVRRYQNPDGTLTEAGKAKYRRADVMEAHKDYKKQWNRISGIIGGGAGAANAIGNTIGLGAVGLLGAPTAIPVIAATAGLTAAGYAAGTKIVSKIVENEHLRRIRELDDEAVKSGRDITKDTLSVYGKYKVDKKERT